MYPRHYGRRRMPGMALAMLIGQMAQVGFGNIPPVTLAAIVGQICIFLRLLDIRWPHHSEVCISALQVWYRNDYRRLLLSPFFHLDEWHLYFNMVSLLWKGIKLERRFGSRYFLYLLAVFAVLTSALYVGLALAAEEYLHNSHYLTECAVGFSGVLFALKVITTHMSSGTQTLLGFIPVPSRYACWAELLLIHLMVPRTSFIGHLAGILIGLLYVKGPLKYIMDMFMKPEFSAGSTSGSGFSGPRYRDWGAGSTGHSGGGTSTRTGHSDYVHYTGGQSEEEQLQHAMRESLRQPGGRPVPSAPPLEEETTTSVPPYPTDDELIPSSSNYSPYPSHGPSVSTSASSNRHSGQHLYPNLSHLYSHGETTIKPPSVTAEEIRQRRIQRFDKQTDR